MVKITIVLALLIAFGLAVTLSGFYPSAQGGEGQPSLLVRCVQIGPYSDVPPNPATCSGFAPILEVCPGDLFKDVGTTDFLTACREEPECVPDIVVCGSGCIPCHP